MSPLLQLTFVFGRLSLLAVGGANATVPEIARQAITLHHWVTAAQFPQLYAISNAAPGPNVMIATVIGAHLAGIPGGITATLAMVLPSCTLAAIIARIFARHSESRWRRVAQSALLPITAGLVLAAALILARQSDTGWLTTAITLATAALAWRTRLHPLLLLTAGAALGLALL